IYGEGPTQVGGGMHGESGGVRWTAQDIRFTTKGDVLYAYAMEWPEDGRIVIPALANSAGRVDRIELLGSTDALRFEQTADALIVTLPSGRPVDFAPGVKIRGSGLV
ncbi:MAG: alpha-L-fucosidase, partial [Brevundimonas sp.]